MGPGTLVDSATSTSPFGSTWIQRGCLSPDANALTLRPGAAIGVWPSLHPLAVGIFSVGMAPCDFAAGIIGALPKAGTGVPPCMRRNSTVTSPISATPRANMVETLIFIFPLVARRLTGTRHKRFDDAPTGRSQPAGEHRT